MNSEKNYKSVSKSIAVISKNHEDFKITMSNLYPLGKIVSGGNKFEYNCDVYYCISMIDHGYGYCFDYYFCTEESYCNRNFDDIHRIMRPTVRNITLLWKIPWFSLYKWKYCNYKIYGILLGIY